MRLIPCITIGDSVGESATSIGGVSRRMTHDRDFCRRSVGDCVGNPVHARIRPRRGEAVGDDRRRVQGEAIGDVRRRVQGEAVGDVRRRLLSATMSAIAWAMSAMRWRCLRRLRWRSRRRSVGDFRRRFCR